MTQSGLRRELKPDLFRLNKLLTDERIVFHMWTLSTMHACGIHTRMNKSSLFAHVQSSTLRSFPFDAIRSYAVDVITVNI